MCESLCFSCFAFLAALNVGAGSAFIWLGFEVIVFLSHLSNYVTSRESKTGIAWKNIFRNPVARLLKGRKGFLCGAYSQLISHVLNGTRWSAITISSLNVQLGAGRVISSSLNAFLPSFPCYCAMLTSSWENRVEQFTSQKLYPLEMPPNSRCLCIFFWVFDISHRLSVPCSHFCHAWT